MALVARAWHVADGITDAALVVLALGVGYAASDWVSGLAHWFFDTFFEEDTPVIGPLLIRPFREHHRDPMAMTHHGFLELNGNNCLGLILPLAAVTLFGPVAPASARSRFLLFFLVVFFLGIAVTNRLHGWAHASDTSSIVRWLQARGWILSPERHRRHHQPPYAQAYCVTHGWMNPVLDRAKFFHVAERVLVTLGLPRSTREPNALVNR